MLNYWRLIGIIIGSALFGLIIGRTSLVMLLAILIYTFWLQQQWIQLGKWVNKPKKNPSPKGIRAIDEACRTIEKTQQQNRSRKKKLAGYLKRFQAATDALPDAIVVLGQYGEINWANHVAKELIGITWPKDSKNRIYNLIRDPAFQELINLETGQVTANKAVMVDSPLDKTKKLEVRVIDYTGDNQMLIAQDITKTVRLQVMRRDFVANVSHELRTPLTVLMGYLEMFNTDVAGFSPSQWQKALPVMCQQTERMSDMVHELLLLSHLEMGENVLTIAPVNVEKVISEVIDDAHHLEAYEQQHIHFNGQENPHWLLADKNQLRSVVSNLLFNAVKYTPAESDIHITWQVDKKQGVLTVEDNGNGIAEHHIERLTERFYRVDKGRTQGKGGSGLGLAIVKHILQRHDAKLSINSKLGVGTTFRCHFPITAVIEEPVDSFQSS